MRTLQRSWRWLLLAWLLAPAVLLAACGGDGDDEEAEPQAKQVSGTFAGKVPGTTAFVSVVASKPSGGSDERDVRVYVCSSTSKISEWFPAKSAGNEVSAPSKNSLVRDGARTARVQVKLRPDVATGAVTLPDGKRYDFEAERASGPGGFYEILVRPDGAVAGTAENGNRFRGQFSGGTVEGVITGPGGTRLRKFGWRVPAGKPPFGGRLIVLRNGDQQGRGVQLSGVGTTTTQLSQVSQLQLAEPFKIPHIG